MVKIELKEIVSNHDNRRKALNAVERGNKKTNPQYPYYGANGIVDFIDEYIFDEELLCIAEDGGNWGYKQNCSYIVNGKYWVNNHVHVLKPKKNVEIKYLMYYLNYIDLTSYITGTTRGKLTRTALDKIQINLPELEIQREIVIILDKINNLIEKNKERIIYLEELVKSRFIEMFGDPIKNDKGWEVKKLFEVADVRDGTHSNPRYIENGIPLVTSKNIKKDGINFENINFISEEDYNNINKRSKVDNGDIIMPMIGTIGNPIIINTNKKFSIKNVCLIKFSNIKLINYYCKYLFSIEFIKSKTNFRGGTQKFISLKDIRNIEIPLPPLLMQNEFAEFVTKTNKFKVSLQLKTIYFYQFIKKVDKRSIVFLDFFDNFG